MLEIPSYKLNYYLRQLLHNKLVVPLKKTKKTRLFVRTSAYYILKSSGFDPIYRPYLIAAILKLCWVGSQFPGKYTRLILSCAQTCVVVVSQGLGQEAQGVLSQVSADQICVVLTVLSDSSLGVCKSFVQFRTCHRIKHMETYTIILLQ